MIKHGNQQDVLLLGELRRNVGTFLSASERVRDLFNHAKRKAARIIVINELLPTN